MTDNEIIKALECCIKNTCSECPFYKNWSTHRCGELRNLTLDLIKQLKERDKKNENIIRYADKTIEKQQAETAEANEKLQAQADTIFLYEKVIKDKTAEIERLKSRVEATEISKQKLLLCFKTAKSEAIKEFAERLKNLTAYYWLDEINIGDIDNLVKKKKK